MQTPYSTSKPLFWKDRVNSLVHGEQPNPVHVQLIISDWCNHDCSFCAYRMSGSLSNELFQIEKGQSRKARNPKRFLSEKKCYEILDDCVRMDVKSVQFTGGGEPTVHPKFIKIVRYAQDVGLQTALVTNGSLLTPAIFDDLIRMAWIRVSVDSSNADHYSEMRGVGRSMFKRVANGIRDFASYTKENGSKTVVGVGFVVTPDNWREMKNAATMYRILGAHNVRLGVMFNPLGVDPYKEHRREIEELSRETARDVTTPAFTVINRVPEKLAELEIGNPLFSACPIQNFTTYIGADANVYRCCVYAYNLRGLIGSLKDQSFMDLWKSQAKRASFNSFDARTCERCQFTEINSTVNSAVKAILRGEDVLPKGKPPMHAEFT